MSAEKKRRPAASADAPEAPPQKVVIVRQDGSTEEMGAESGLVVFAVAKDGHTSLRTMATRGQILFSVKMILQLLSEAHDAQCSVTRGGQKCAEGMKFGAADLLIIELIALGSRPVAPMPPLGTATPTGTNGHFN